MITFLYSTVQFLLFFGIFYAILHYLKPDVKLFGQVVIGINVFAVWLYIAGIFNQSIVFQDATPKIFLHALVAIIIYTVLRLEDGK
mgnify:FL=1